MGILGVPALRMMPFSQKEFSRRDAVVRLQRQMCSASVRRRKAFCRRKATSRSSWSCGSSSHCTVRGFCVRTPKERATSPKERATSPKERATSPKEKVSESETVATFLITKLGRRRLMNKKKLKNFTREGKNNFSNPQKITCIIFENLFGPYFLPHQSLLLCSFFG